MHYPFMVHSLRYIRVLSIAFIKFGVGKRFVGAAASGGRRGGGGKQW